MIYSKIEVKCGVLMYDYKESKKRVEEILNSELEIKHQKYLPESMKIEFDKGYYTWVSSIFIDIRDSSNLFKTTDDKKISKLSKAFISELIAIIRASDNLRLSRIVGDCACAIYTAPNPEDLKDLYEKASICNTYIKMLNILLKEHDLPSFKAGIGLGYSEVLLVNTARGEIDIDDKIWIGDAVIDACNFSSVANKDEYKEIVMSKEFYDNIAKINNQAKEIFEMKHHPAYGEIYTGESLIPEFNKWIDNDFKD